MNPCRQPLKPEAGEERLLISPSILAADFAHLADGLASLETGGADLVHVDVMDGHFVPNITIGPPVVASLRKYSRLPFDTHLMLTDPAKYVEAFAKAGTDHITFHVESNSDVTETIKLIRSFGCSAGLTLRPGTDIDDVMRYLSLIDMVLVMTVEPGFGGQSFMPEMIDKVRAFCRELDRIGHAAYIQVDGGITDENIALVTEAGADCIVAGTFVFRHKSGVKGGVDALRKNAVRKN